MTTDPAPSAPFEVLIAGGGVAALEAALALRDLAGDRLTLKLISASPDFIYRPTSVQEPFSFGGAERYPLQEIAGDIGLELVEDTLESVDPEAGQSTPQPAPITAMTRCCWRSAPASGRATSTPPRSTTAGSTSCCTG